MLTDILAIARRAQATVFADLAGATLLMVMLVSALHLPVL